MILDQISLCTYRVPIDLCLIEVRALEVVEVWKDVPVLLLVVLCLQLEHGRDELRETEQLSYDGVASGHQLQDGLAAVVIRREKVLSHGEACGDVLKSLTTKLICRRLDKRREDGEVLLCGDEGGGALA